MEESGGKKLVADISLTYQGPGGAPLPMFEFEDDSSCSAEECESVILTERGALSTYLRPEVVSEIILDVGVGAFLFLSSILPPPVSPSHMSFVDEMPSELRQMIHLTRLVCHPSPELCFPRSLPS